jgi:hypothetical protein
MNLNLFKVEENKECIPEKDIRYSGPSSYKVLCSLTVNTEEKLLAYQTTVEI